MRKATEEDVLSLAQLEIQLFPENCMNEMTLTNELEVGECWLIEGDNPKRIWGYCLIRRDGELLDLLRIGVVKERRSVGVATTLLTHVLELSPTVMLTVKKDNQVALRMYMKHGFKIVGQLAADAGWIMKRG